ncbi:uncharacterized protein N7483_000473 [Penicillium malachiteum]|uniref:uncharacterized protein n=1 Tax=Penicillium malachiteum TaxID=1324776 RepID=UPI002547A88D|nr:uncharacterized protein N7483_000473 [Penicillium malachiteum]KAJ5735348.1 hypothetical protein N7483_000473 [Penicillium malachiteum]
MYERQRVWRACQACRRKKVKCDGQHPCQSCTRNNGECVFEAYSNMRLMDPQYVKKLENRISQMETEMKKHHSDRDLRVEESVQSSADSPTANPGFSEEDIQDDAQPTPGASDPSTDFLLCAPSIDAAAQVPENLPAYVSHGADDNSNFVMENEFDDSNAQRNARAISEPTKVDVTQLEEPILEVLIDLFYRSIYPICPIIHSQNFRSQYDHWLAARRGDNSYEGNDDDFPCLLYALLAVAASMLPKTHAVFERPGLQIYKSVDLADLLHSQATRLDPRRPRDRNAIFPTNPIVSQGLLSIYLTENGRVNDAWVTVGHAIRLYQGLDLDQFEDSAAEDTRNEHKKLWWCLYILDRSLSTALLKPLAIDDADSDVESFSEENKIPSTDSRTDPWFSVVADFHVTMGRIYRSVRRIRKSEPSKSAKLRDSLKSHVQQHDAELEKYYRTQVLPKIEEPNRQIGPLALQTIAISSYYIGIVLLYRAFIERHNITEPEIFLRCVEAASNCIKVTPQVIATVPASHFVIQQSRAIYASTRVLLHCMRLAQNPRFTNKAWSEVENGFNMLRDIKIQWPEIKKYQTLTAADMHATQSELNKHALFYQTFDRYGQTSHARLDVHEVSPTLQIDQARNKEASRHLNLDSNVRDEGPNNSPPKRRICHSTPGLEYDDMQPNPKRQRLTPESFFPCDPTAILEMLPDLGGHQDYHENHSLSMNVEFSDIPLSLLGDHLTADPLGDSTLLNSIEQFMSYPSD